jgi:hypothetical protein
MTPDAAYVRVIVGYGPDSEIEYTVHRPLIDRLSIISPEDGQMSISLEVRGINDVV